MTLLVDQHEPAALDLYLHQFAIPTERQLLNRPAAIPRPDYGWHLPDGSYLGVSRKQAGEFIGGIDACESQLLDEMGGCDYMALLIEGRFGPAPYGCYTYDYDEIKGRERDGVTYGTATGVRRLFRQSYKGVRQKLARFCDLGIYVLETHNVEDTAYCLAALYTELQKPEASLTTFKRLIPEKWRLDEPDADIKRFCLQVMGACPGIGEEIARATADWVKRSPMSLTLFGLMWCLNDADNSPGMPSLAKEPIRTKEGVKGRTVGPAAVLKIKQALGC
jgi:hypothetical protein